MRVRPNSRKPRIELAGDGSLVVHVRAAPTEGRANEELEARLARHYGVPRSQVLIKTGHGSRTKLVQIG